MARLVMELDRPILLPLPPSPSRPLRLWIWPGSKTIHYPPDTVSSAAGWTAPHHSSAFDEGGDDGEEEDDEDDGGDESRALLG